MKRDLDHLESHLLAIPDNPGEDGAAYEIARYGRRFRFIVSWGGGWDHVSMSLPNRVPTWEEMCWAKSIFFEPHETVMQLHPPEVEYVNNHPYCLHLWRPQNEAIPVPPISYV